MFVQLSAWCAAAFCITLQTETFVDVPALVIGSDVLRTPAHELLLHLMVHADSGTGFIGTTARRCALEQQHKTPSFDDAICCVLHFQCGIQTCITSMHTPLGA